MSKTEKGFTLIELLVVLALIAILATVLIVAIRPQEIFKKARDTQRSGDLRNLDMALMAYLMERSQTANIILDNANNTTCVGGTASDTIYASVGYGEGATNLSPFVWTKGTTSQEINGTGWLPVNFAGVGILQVGRLPRDPLNRENPSYYYTYACKTDFNYELNARMEADFGKAANDGGNNPNLYEVGSDKNILPSSTGTRFYQFW